MARGPKPLTMYPAIFLVAAEAAFKGEDVRAWHMPDEKAAIGTRHHFNRFRRALAEQMHPHAEAASDLILRLEGSAATGWEIVFVRRGLYTPGQLYVGIADFVVPGIDDVARPAAQADNTEQLVEDWLKQGRAPIASPPNKDSSIQPCEHEWDVTGSRCLKCNQPKGEEQ